MFENEDEAKAQVLRDKHTLLEGYVTEFLFEKQFLSGREDTYTSGWWSALNGSERFFFAVKKDLNQVDKKVFQILKQKFHCWIAYMDQDKWKFNDGINEYCEMDFLEKYGLKAKKNKLQATSDTKDSERQHQCIEFFRENGLLKKIAVERNFADDFLTIYFNSMVNIDYITENANHQLCVMEIKYKYENRAGNFGINSGQVLMFEVLEDIGFEIHHMILYNHTKDKYLSVFGFLKLQEADTCKYWLYGRLSDFSRRKRSIAPKETSVDGKKEQLYYSFGKNEITKRITLKNL